ncbi:thermonuclease family protein [Marinobacter sp.]|uniref:thermonuclease family protein n=1 Tax=Marinobacter sp. TaxID=50741 RepID=UPI003569C1E9
MIALRLIALLLVSLPAFAEYGSAVVSEVTSIYDADTFRANISGWPPIIGERAPIRVKGVDAPELRGKCESEKVQARKAKKFTVAKLRGARTIRLDELERGKYFRILAVVYVDGENLAQALINAGLARPYDGGTRQGWCSQ